ncbi:hypothetical protein BDN72DRAFT_902152 [Pluteus cervinus]|uniref:Uncharacterized protein n=1 Tax=Pluteus cervinus TaxID=181527 RepID=A0ACD3ADR9_9AGAR|nr:hypothetical protein BDN72DRAFT_902152 [Pluteus cervinus]
MLPNCLRDFCEFEDLPWKCLSDWEAGDVTVKALLTSADAITVLSTDMPFVKQALLTGTGLEGHTGRRISKILAEPLLHYVLADTLVWLNLGVDRCSIHPPRHSMNLLDLIDITPVKTWDSLVINRHQDLLSRQQAQTCSISASLPRVYRVFLNVCRTLCREGTQQALTNFQMVGLRLALILDGAGATDTLSKLAEDLKEENSTIVKLVHELGLQDVDPTAVLVLLKKHIDTWDHTLLLAAFASPLYLLSGNNFIKKQIARWKSIKAFVCVGGSKPQAIRKTEYALYTALFQIANGVLAEDAVQGACASVIDAVSSVTSVERNWFSHCANPVTPPSSRSSCSKTPTPIVPAATYAASNLSFSKPPNPLEEDISYRDHDVPQVDSKEDEEEDQMSKKHSSQVIDNKDEDEDEEERQATNDIQPEAGDEETERGGENGEDGQSRHKKQDRKRRFRDTTIGSPNTSPSTSPKKKAPVSKKFKSRHTELKQSSRVNQHASKLKSRSTAHQDREEGEPLDDDVRCIIKDEPWDYDVALPTTNLVYSAIQDCTDEREIQGIDPITSMPEQKLIHSTRTFQLWASDGQPFDYSPVAHSHTELLWLEAVLDVVIAGYNKSDNRPAFLSSIDQLQGEEGTTSGFRIITREEFRNMQQDPNSVQSAFRTQNLIIRGDDRRFKKLNTSIITQNFGGGSCLTILRELHDLSVPTSDASNEHYRLGTLIDIAENSDLPEDKQRLMNILSIPLGWATATELGLQSDEQARRTHIKNCKLFTDAVKELSGRFWGLAATDGTFHQWHVDANGFATFIDVHAGLKLWIIATPLNPDDLANPTFTAGFQVYHAMPKNCRIEAVILTAGDGLRMQPFLPHAVITLKASICTGGHYIARSTLRRTVYGILQCFSTGSVLTNTEHTDTSTFLIGLLVCVYHELYTTLYISNPAALYTDSPHLPYVLSFEGMVDLMMLINLCELSNILHFRTYRADPKQSLSALQLDQMIEARRRARHLRNWLWHYFDLVADDPDATERYLSPQTLYWDLLAGQCRALVFHNRLSTRKDRHGDAQITGDILENFIQLTFKGNDAFEAAWTRQKDCDSYGYQGPTFNVSKKVYTADYIKGSEDGMNATDRIWKQGNRFHQK